MAENLQQVIAADIAADAADGHGRTEKANEAAAADAERRVAEAAQGSKGAAADMGEDPSKEHVPSGHDDGKEGSGSASTPAKAHLDTEKDERSRLEGEHARAMTSEREEHARALAAARDETRQAVEQAEKANEAAVDAAPKLNGIQKRAQQVLHWAGVALATGLFCFLAICVAATSVASVTFATIAVVVATVAAAVLFVFLPGLLEWFLGFFWAFIRNAILWAVTCIFNAFGPIWGCTIMFLLLIAVFSALYRFVTSPLSFAASLVTVCAAVQLVLLDYMLHGYEKCCSGSLPPLWMESINREKLE